MSESYNNEIIIQDTDVSKYEIEQYLIHQKIIGDIQSEISITDINDVIPIKSKFTVSFNINAIHLLKRIAKYVEGHVELTNMVNDLNPFEIDEFDRFFEQKLAMYVALYTEHTRPADIYIITYNDVINAINKFIGNGICNSRKTFPPEESMKNMLNGYPILLLSKICQTTYENAYIMGESIKQFIEIRKTYPKWLPLQLHLVIEGKVPLIGHSGSPLDKNELDAIYTYLGSRKSIYVNILLNCLFEMSTQEKYIFSLPMNEDQIINICKSSWLYLFLFASTQNISNFMHSEYKILKTMHY